jgi:hypothetical protein
LLVVQTPELRARAARQLLCLLLEVREQMRKMNARLERIGAHVERIDARVCRMERGGSCLVPPVGDAPGPCPVAVRARAMRLLDLPADLLVIIASQLAEDDDLAAALACRRLLLSSRLEWAAVSCGLPLSSRLLRRAAPAGRLEQLSWLRTRGCAWAPCYENGNDCCSSAAASGHLAVLQWLRANGCPWEEWTCIKAAAKGHLHVLQWARASGCPWNAGTCSGAARGGHLAVLPWLRVNARGMAVLQCTCI